MNIRKMQKLEKLGFDQEWLDDVKFNFKPKKQGKYEIKIYHMDQIDEEPDTGIWIDTTRFSTDLELSIVHYFFEGLGYVMTLAETGEEIGRGILDESPFEEVDEEWELKIDEAKEFIENQKALRDAKPTEYVKKRKKKNTIVTARFILDEDLLMEQYKEYYGINNLQDALSAELTVMEVNGVVLDDWKIEK